MREYLTILWTADNTVWVKMNSCSSDSDIGTQSTCWAAVASNNNNSNNNNNNNDKKKKQKKQKKKKNKMKVGVSTLCYQGD